jgi:hypothetical protein
MKKKLFLLGMSALCALGMAVMGCDTPYKPPTDVVVTDTGDAKPFLSTQSPDPISSPDLLFSYKDSGLAKGIYHIGTISDQIISYDWFYHDGHTRTEKTYTLSTTTETFIASTITSSVEVAINASTTAKMSVGAEIDTWVGTVMAQAELSTTVGTSLKALESFQKSETVKTTVTNSKTDKLTFDNQDPEGYYIFGSIAFVDYFVEVSVDTKTEAVVGKTVYPGMPSPPGTALLYSKTSPFGPDGKLIIGNNKKLNVDFKVNPAEIISKAGEQAPSVGYDRDVWGKKLLYTYKVLYDGELSYSLTGGGAGGAGAAACRNAHFWWGQDSKADAGWSADGGPTVLKVDGAVIARANGGKQVNGPNSGSQLNKGNNPWSSTGVKGKDGEEKTGTLYVSAGSIITIEVGWGGGGSGGAAINDVTEYISSGPANLTTGSAGKSSEVSGQTSAKASRGGYGALHYQKTGNADYTGTDRGGASPAAENAAVAQGGQKKGEGGAAGQVYTTGGMYASGGGGGAAGGFALKSSDVALTEME